MKQFSGSSVLTRNPHVQPISFSRAQQSKPSKSWWFLRWGDFSTCHKLSLASSLTKMGPTSPSCRRAPLYTPVTLPDPSALYSPQSLWVPSPVLFPQTLSSWLQLRSCLLPGPLSWLPIWPGKGLSILRAALNWLQIWILDSNFLLLPDQCITWGMPPELWSWGDPVGLLGRLWLWPVQQPSALVPGFWSIETAGNHCQTPLILFFNGCSREGHGPRGYKRKFAWRPLGKLSFLN